jgi:hypothetical protein
MIAVNGVSSRVVATDFMGVQQVEGVPEPKKLRNVIAQTRRGLKLKKGISEKKLRDKIE